MRLSLACLMLVVAGTFMGLALASATDHLTSWFALTMVALTLANLWLEMREYRDD